MARYSKSFVLVAVVFSLLFVSSGYINGYRLKKSIERSVNPFLTTKMVIDHAYLNAFTGNGSIEGISVLNPPGTIGKDAVYIEKIEIHGGPTSLHGERMHFSSIKIQGVEIYFLQTAQGSNVSTLFRKSYQSGDDEALKEMVIDQFELSPMKIYLGPKLMNQNPFQATLSEVVVTKDQLKDERMRTLGAYLADRLLTDVESLQAQRKLPISEDMEPKVKQALGLARQYIKKYQ